MRRIVLLIRGWILLYATDVHGERAKVDDRGFLDRGYAISRNGSQIYFLLWIVMKALGRRAHNLSSSRVYDRESKYV